MAIIQDSQSLDAAALARAGFDAGSDLAMGVVRVDGEQGPWSVRVRLDYGPSYGPDAFGGGMLVPPIDILVREGGSRGSQTWGAPAPLTVRDASFVVHAASVDVAVRVHRAANPRGCTVVAWVTKGSAPESFMPSESFAQQTIADWRDIIRDSTQETCIPPDVHEVDVLLPETISGQTITYPVMATFVDPSGNVVVEVPLTTTATMRTNKLVVPSRARWLAIVGGGYNGEWPVVYRRH